MLESRGAAISRAVTDSTAHTVEVAREAAKSNMLDALIVAGGDGTIRDAASGLLGHALPFGVIPAGTGNVLAAELGLPRDPAGLADYLCRGDSRPVTGGTANGKLFLFMAGVGLDAEIVSRLDSGLARRIGRAAYVPAILSALAAPPRPELTVRHAGAAVTARWVVVAKSSRFGGSFILTRKAGLLKDGLQLVTVQSKSHLGDAIRLAAVPMGLLHHMPGVRIDACAGVVTVKAERPVPVQIDGDILGTTPVEIDQASAPVNIIVPFTAL